MEDNNGACFWDRAAKSDETESLLWEIMGNMAFSAACGWFLPIFVG
jgi:hypothetical protein